MRLLIYLDMEEYAGSSLNGTCADIFRRADYNTVADDIRQNCGGINTNTGNKVWFQSIVSELSTPENKLSLYDGKESWDEINEKYDAVILSAANLINPIYKKHICYLSSIIKKSKIPVFVISVGAQAKSFDNLYELRDSLKNEVSDFVQSVYNTGGEIACRGFFTKDVFDSICKNSAEVVGCPSLFQNGKQLAISKQKCSSNQLKPVFNGTHWKKQKVFRDYPYSVYIDQDEFFSELYDDTIYTGKKDEAIIRAIIRRHGYEAAGLFLQGKIKLFWDIPDWRRYLINNGFNFSIGSRIHGTVMSILSGIPSVLCAVDSRTREMGEFYGIPVVYPGEYDESLYELYLSTDYSAFNKKFLQNYNNFNAFLKKYGLVREINENNIFWNKEEPIPNLKVSARLERIRNTYEKEALYWHTLEFASRVKHVLK